MNQDRSKITYLLAIVAAVSYGLQPLLGRFALNSCPNPVLFNAYRSIAEGLFLYIASSVFEKDRTKLPLRAAIGLGVLQGLALNLHIGSLLFAPVGAVTVCVFLYPLFVALLEGIVSRKVESRILMLVMVAFVGVVITVSSGISGGSIGAGGIGMAISAALILSIYLCILARLKYPFGCTLGMIIAFISSGVSFGINAGLARLCSPSTETLFWAVATGACGAIGTASMFKALSKASGSFVSLVLNAEIVVTVVGAHLLFSEPLGIRQILGMALIVGAIVGAKQRRAHSA